MNVNRIICAIASMYATNISATCWGDIWDSLCCCCPRSNRNLDDDSSIGSTTDSDTESEDEEQLDRLSTATPEERGLLFSEIALGQLIHQNIDDNELKAITTNALCCLDQTLAFLHTIKSENLESLKIAMEHVNTIASPKPIDTVHSLLTKEVVPNTEIIDEIFDTITEVRSRMQTANDDAQAMRKESPIILSKLYLLAYIVISLDGENLFIDEKSKYIKSESIKILSTALTDLRKSKS